MADRPVMFAPTRGFSGMADSMEPCTMLWGRSLLLWQRHFRKFGLFFDKIAHESSCMPDRPDMFGPTSGDDQRGRLLLPRQRHLSQARSLIAYRLVDSAPARSLLFFVVDSVCMSVCLSVCNALQIDSSSLFLHGIEPFLGHLFSMTKTTKRCSSNFALLPWQRNLGYFGKKFKLLLLFCFPMESSHFLVVSSP